MYRGGARRLGAGRAQPPKTHSQMVHDTVDHHVIPHMEKLRGATRRWRASSAGLCEQRGRSRAALAKAKASFAETVAAWAGVEFMRFGPDGRRRARRALCVLAGHARHSVPAAAAGAGQARCRAAGAGRTGTAERCGAGAARTGAHPDGRKEAADRGDDEDGRYRCAFAAAIGANLDADRQGTRGGLGGGRRLAASHVRARARTTRLSRSRRMRRAISSGRC